MCGNIVMGSDYGSCEKGRFEMTKLEAKEYNRKIRAWQKSYIYDYDGTENTFSKEFLCKVDYGHFYHFLDNLVVIGTKWDNTLKRDTEYSVLSNNGLILGTFETEEKAVSYAENHL